MESAGKAMRRSFWGVLAGLFVTCVRFAAGIIFERELYQNCNFCCMILIPCFYSPPQHRARTRFQEQGEKSRIPELSAKLAQRAWSRNNFIGGGHNNYP